MASSVVKTTAGRSPAGRPVRWAVVLVLLLSATACKKDKREPAGNPPYAQDIERICFAEERSGALEQEPGRRSLVVAHWLGNALKTDESRVLLGRLARMPPRDKSAVLRAEASKLGIERCPMAAVWSAEK